MMDFVFEGFLSLPSFLSTESTTMQLLLAILIVLVGAIASLVQRWYYNRTLLKGLVSGAAPNSRSVDIR